MSGISKSFKFPGVIRKRKAVSHGLPTFDLEKVTILRDLGFGGFGSVHLGSHVCGAGVQSVVVKKLRGESEDAKCRFLKEAKILNGINDVITVCMRDVVNGLEFLHGIEIAHRDLKPSNILVSNQHYAQKEQAIIEREYQACPIVCKVADFGLSRSLDAQTQTVLDSRTNHIYHGTPVYMAPEIQIGSLTTATQSDLMKMDIWSLGILAHAMMNPNLSRPYSKEVEQLGVQFGMDVMKHFMQLQKLPSNDAKYTSPIGLPSGGR